MIVLLLASVGFFSGLLLGSLAKKGESA